MRVLRVARAVAAWTVIAIFAGLIASTVLVPRLAGATPYTVMTGSMRPELPPGTVVVVRPVPVESIGLGEVVTYQLESGKPEVVTHRVVSIGDNKRYGRVLQTQGDANTAPDQAWVIDKQVRGKLWYSVPKVGYVTNLLNGRQRDLLASAIAMALLAYAGLMWWGAAKDKRGRRVADRRTS